jgi:hypothetical protein
VLPNQRPKPLEKEKFPKDANRHGKWGTKISRTVHHHFPWMQIRCQRHSRQSHSRRRERERERERESVCMYLTRNKARDSFLFNKTTLIRKLSRRLPNGRCFSARLPCPLPLSTCPPPQNKQCSSFGGGDLMLI